MAAYAAGNVAWRHLFHAWERIASWQAEDGLQDAGQTAGAK